MIDYMYEPVINKTKLKSSPNLPGSFPPWTGSAPVGEAAILEGK